MATLAPHADAAAALEASVTTDDSHVHNPIGLDGFEFVEFTSPEPERMAARRRPTSYP